MSLHSETPIKSTVSKVAALIGTITSAAFGLGVYVTVQLSAMRADTAETNRRLYSIETFMRNEAVTQSQAERYANVFRWENRNLQISVPAPSEYQDKPKS